MVFALIQIQEECQEQNKGLYVTFIDMAKASDTMSRTGLWKILEKAGCPPKFLIMVIQLHKNQLTQVRHNNYLSQPCTIKNGMKQGCVLAPTLKDKDCVYICFCTNCNLFNPKHLQAHTKTLEKMIIELLFEDAAALVTHSESSLQ